MNFTELSLDASLLNGIADAGYETCTPVQEQVLSGAMKGADLYVQSQTGTGKTAAYLINIFQQLLTNAEMKGKKALIMVPTRELAVQVEEEAKVLGHYTGLKAASFYGGVGYEQQKSKLEKGVDILIGTPGRVIDLQESGSMDLSNVAFLVVDEADRMFDMGFYPDLRTLIKVLPGTDARQTMLFSATLNTYVKNLAWEYTDDAQEITIECEHITVSEIDQLLYHVSSDEKIKLLCGILSREKPESVIIFCNTKRTVEVVAKRLQYNGFETEFIIGDLPQSKRLQIIDSFKKGSLKCLVATDIAARGIDVDNLAMVVNFDLPNEAENYVHRIGRTARAGKSGKAYTFCSEQDVYSLPAIERYIEMQIPSEVADASLMAEDKSAGIYIKTANYYDDERDSRGRGRGRRGDERRARDGGRGDRRRDGSKRYGSKGDFKRGEFKGRGKKPADSADFRKEAEELSGLSFEERMKVYKQKYAGSANTAPAATEHTGEKSRSYQKGGNGGKKRYNGKGAKRQNQSYNRRNDSAKPAAGYNKRGAQKPEQAKPAKQGLFAKIKGFFSKK
ncbi:MAG: DEAD/DEAH box helicase [Spirochaetaceae bacterium]|nr:DEAD/DEAH box helicase [Spirochaetaceae bacterium]